MKSPEVIANVDLIVVVVVVAVIHQSHVDKVLAFLLMNSPLSVLVYSCLPIFPPDTPVYVKSNTVSSDVRFYSQTSAVTMSLSSPTLPNLDLGVPKI